MRLRDCEGCEYASTRTWSHYHKCVNYHPIGMTHRYAYCEKQKKRISEIKNCEEKAGEQE